MTLQPEDIQALDQRAQQVGEWIGWKLRFYVLPNPQYVGLTAGPDNVMVVGPSKISELAVHEIDLILDALERGERTIQPDEDGDPRLL